MTQIKFIFQRALSISFSFSLVSPMDLLRQSLGCLLIVASLSPTALSMQFELRSGQMKCISEDIHEKSISVGKYFVVNPNEDHPLPDSHKITAKVVRS